MLQFFDGRYIQMENWLIKFNQEVETAHSARSRGNEGMARVCARRAAGAIAGEFLRRCNAPDPGPNAYDRLSILAQMIELSGETRQIVSHFLLRITPEHTLPVEADLIAEATWLKEKLLNQP